MDRRFFEKVLDGLVAKGSANIAFFVCDVALAAKQGESRFRTADHNIERCVTDMLLKLTVEEIEYLESKYVREGIKQIQGNTAPGRTNVAMGSN